MIPFLYTEAFCANMIQGHTHTFHNKHFIYLMLVHNSFILAIFIILRKVFHSLTHFDITFFILSFIIFLLRILHKIILARCFLGLFWGTQTPAQRKEPREYGGSSSRREAPHLHSTKSEVLFVDIKHELIEIPFGVFCFIAKKPRL